MAERRVKTRREAVNHPLHYGGDVPHEVYKCLRAWGLEFGSDADAFLWNVITYIARRKRKGTELEDLEKAKWYLDRRIEQLKEGRSPAPKGERVSEPC